MHPPIDDWDAAYLLSIATPEESAELEKKGSDLLDLDSRKNDAKAELAKQVSAFSNTGGGFLVYGISKTGGLDAGVTDAVGSQSIKAWVEGIIPNLLFPSLNGCTAKFIHVHTHHQPRRGAIVVSIPASDRRPHWVLGGNEVAYIRAGEHSFPMRRQTFLDLSSHGGGQSGIVEGLNIFEQPSIQDSYHQFTLNPIVKLLGGQVCDLWYFDMSVTKGMGFFRASPNFGLKLHEDHVVEIRGQDPLFPLRPTKVSPINFQMHLSRRPQDGNLVVKASLWLRSGKADEKVFRLNEVVYEKSADT